MNATLITSTIVSGIKKTLIIRGYKISKLLIYKTQCDIDKVTLSNYGVEFSCYANNIINHQYVHFSFFTQTYTEVF